LFNFGSNKYQGQAEIVSPGVVISVLAVVATAVLYAAIMKHVYISRKGVETQGHVSKMKEFR